MQRHHAEPISLRGVHVLVVCDDLERCTLFAQALRYEGALVTTAHSADDANAAMERQRANVIVVELGDADALLASGFQLHAAMPVRAAELCAAVATLARQSTAWPRL